MSWQWMLDDDVEPAPDALDELHRARALRPDAVLLASKVVVPGGTLDPGSAPMPRILDKADAIDAARAGLLAVRAVHSGSLLVRDELAARLEGRPHRGWFAITASALTAGRGYLVPRSIAARNQPAPVDSPLARARLVTARFWTREERLLQLYALAGGARRRGRQGQP